VSGDFNGDGRGDIALTGGFSSPGVPWNSVPVALSVSDGAFFVRNQPISDGFGTMASQSGVKAVSGDFNHDGKGDIALTGGAFWNSVPVAFSGGGLGSFNVTNQPILDFGAMAAQSGAQAVGTL
jgi:hypothetical protein